MYHVNKETHIYNNYFLYPEITKYFTKLNYGVFFNRFVALLTLKLKNINIEKRKKQQLYTYDGFAVTRINIL